MEQDFFLPQGLVGNPRKNRRRPGVEPGAATLIAAAPVVQKAPVARAAQKAPVVAPTAAVAVARAAQVAPAKNSGIPPNPESKYVAKGTFGCVAKPGLVNKGLNNTDWKQFPSNVSKIFKKEEEYNTAIKSTRKAYNIMGSNSAHTIEEYNYKYETASSLPERLRVNCEFSDRQPIYVTRMPNLGISFYDLASDTTSIDKLHRISFVTILEEIYKVIEQVKKLQEAKYVHGDIREKNVMIDPKDGRISIIDFDWLLPKDEFFREFPLGFYNSPPETIVRYYICSNNYAIDSKQQIEKLLNLIKYDKLDRIPYFNDLDRLFIQSNVGKSLGLTRENVKEMIVDNVKEYITDFKKNKTVGERNKYKEFDNSVFITYDSYSIGYSLLYMMNILYPGMNVSNNIMKESLKGKLYDSIIEYTDDQLMIIANSIIKIKILLADLCNIDVKKRIKIDDFTLSLFKGEIDRFKKSNIFKKVENTIKNAEKELEQRPDPPPAPPHPAPTAPPMSPNKKNNKNNKNNGTRKLPKLPNSPNSLSLSKTRSKSKSN